MAHEWRDIITEYLGVEPVLIDSKKMSAAMRERVYWTNIWKIKQPKASCTTSSQFAFEILIALVSISEA